MATKGLLAKKIGMTQVFTEKGELLPVTVLEAGPCTVVALRAVQKDGYGAIQLGFGEVKEPLSFKVTALNIHGQRLTNYTGTVVTNGASNSVTITPPVGNLFFRLGP